MNRISRKLPFKAKYHLLINYKLRILDRAGCDGVHKKNRFRGSKVSKSADNEKWNDEILGEGKGDAERIFQIFGKGKRSGIWESC